MSLFRKNPLFAFAMTLCAALVLGELAFIYERYAASRAAERRLAQRRTDLESMTVLMPPPTRAVATAIEADLAQARTALASMQAELKGRGPAAERLRASKPPGARTDAYFDLATFVEKSRAAAARNEVEIRPEAARFGFSSFANEGPMPDHIEAVFRQRQIAQYLVDALIEARPRAIFSIKREATLGKADRDARAAAIAEGQPPPEVHGEEGPDYFVIDPRVTARVPGFIDTVPFRFVFTGQTAALRTFLNRLASFELPVLVREVEVEPATAEESAAAPVVDDAAAAASAPETSVAASVVLTADAPAPESAPPRASRVPRASSATPIVARTLSKFTVTVEFVELAPPAAAPAALDAPVSPPPPS
jgi:hypothetical protein